MTKRLVSEAAKIKHNRGQMNRQEEWRQIRLRQKKQSGALPYEPEEVSSAPLQQFPVSGSIKSV